MRNCFSLRHTSSHNELILSCGDSDQSPILYRQWLDALVAGIESQGGCPLQQQEEEEEDNCLWMGWTYKKGVNNTAWKKRFIRLTSASVTFVEYPLSFACIACGLTTSAGTTPTRLPNPAKGRSTSRRFYPLISNRCVPVRIFPRSRPQSSPSRPALTPPQSIMMLLPDVRGSAVPVTLVNVQVVALLSPVVAAVAVVSSFLLCCCSGREILIMRVGAHCLQVISGRVFEFMFQSVDGALNVRYCHHRVLKTPPHARAKCTRACVKVLSMPAVPRAAAGRIYEAQCSARDESAQRQRQKCREV
jgi:hypothetical protein